MAQFVPTIGTYIAIALPVFVGLVGPEPWQGVALLGFALVYQQIENVTSSRASRPTPSTCTLRCPSQP